MSTTLSLDVSAASTGWCVLSPDILEYGVILTSPKYNRSERLLALYTGLQVVFSDMPLIDNIVIEDTFSGKNVSTTKMLAEFGGVAKCYCQFHYSIDPYVISTKTVKAYFKVKEKLDMFNFLIDVLDKNDLTFNKHNDIVDAIGQAMCYRDTVLGETSYREELDYGFLYKGELIWQAEQIKLR